MRIYSFAYRSWLAGICVALCAAVVAVWVYTWLSPVTVNPDEEAEWTVMLNDGEIMVRWFSDGGVRGDVVAVDDRTFLNSGFYRLHHQQGASASIVVRFWLLLVMAGIYPLVWWRRMRTSRQAPTENVEESDS